MSKTSSNHTSIFTLGALALGSALLMSGCSGEKNSAGQRPAPEVIVAKPIVKTVEIWNRYSGDLAPIEAVDVRARVNGYLESVNFTEGQKVEEGDLLFVIDPRPYQALVDSAKSTVKDVEARISLAKSNLSRAKELHAANAISKEVLDTRQSELLSAEAAMMHAQAQLREAELNLGFTQVRAPISGMVSERLVDRGNLVNANTTLLTTIVRRDTLQIHFDIPERDMISFIKNGLFERVDQQNRKGPPVEVTIPQDPGSLHKGELTYFDNRLGKDTASLTLRADIDNADGKLMPGQNARVRIRMADHKDAVLVPETAVGTDLVDRYVRVVDKDNVVRYRKVNVGQLLGKLRVIDSGLAPDERIIVVGMQKATFDRPAKPTEKTLEEDKPAQ